MAHRSVRALCVSNVTPILFDVNDLRFTVYEQQVLELLDVGALRARAPTMTRRVYRSFFSRVALRSASTAAILRAMHSRS